MKVGASAMTYLINSSDPAAIPFANKETLIASFLASSITYIAAFCFVILPFTVSIKPWSLVTLAYALTSPYSA